MKSNGRKEFISNLYKMKNDESKKKTAIRLRNTTGVPWQRQDITTKMALYSLLEENQLYMNEEDMMIHHFIAGLCVKSEYPNEKRGFAECLGQLKIKRDKSGFENRILNLLNMDWDTNGNMMKALHSIIRMIWDEIGYFNIESLYWDLLEWNSGNAVREDWAKRIIKAK